jgi:hypothetical protein
MELGKIYDEIPTMRKEFRKVVESGNRDDFTHKRIAKLGKEIRRHLKKAGSRFEETCIMENLQEELQDYLNAVG